MVPVLRGGRRQPLRVVAPSPDGARRSAPSVPQPDGVLPLSEALNANDRVDQGAALILCSVEAARSPRVPEDRWVFPLSGADAHDHWFLSHRADLRSSPAIRLAGRAALRLAGVGIDDVAHVDLYSCFPCAVQIAANELGLPSTTPAGPSP